LKKNSKSYFAYLPGWEVHLSARLAWIFFISVSILAIIGPFIANEKPYRCTLEGVTYYPLFSGVSEAELSARHPSFSPVDWRTTSFESIWRAPVSYSHSSIDLKSGSQLSPFDTQPLRLGFRHWLGTDQLGHDVLAGMIRGCRISLVIGLGSMLLALLFGVPMGSFAAYWGNRDWKISWIRFIIGCLLLFIIVSVWYLPLSFPLKTLVSLLLIGIGIFIRFMTKKIKFKKNSMPLDAMVMGIISIVDSFPGLFIILIILVLIPVKGWVVVMATIALLRWPSMARYMRAEVFKMKESNYIKAAQVLNLSNFHILRQHIIPYAFRPVMITFIFGVSSAILAESSLSFLGIGLPAGEMNWGRLLSESRNHFEAWWLVLFPGCAIFFTLLSLYTIGNALQKSVERNA
jgi:peptide/nickel transport system permease protein